MASINQDKILEALSGLVSEDNQNAVKELVSSVLEEAVADLETEYNTRLEEAYQLLAEEREKDWEVAKRGYEQAYEAIDDLRSRLDLQQKEHDAKLDEEFEAAYNMLQEERSKNKNIEEELYEEYDGKLDQVKEYIVDKVDEFLSQKGEEMYESALDNVLNDPTVSEQRLAMENIVDVVGRYVTNEDLMLHTNNRVEELATQLESASHRIRQMEAKNMRLMTENNKLGEVAREYNELLEEHVLNEQNERVEAARKAEGRGHVDTDEKRHVLIGEATDEPLDTRSHVVDDDEALTMNEQWQVLAGVKKRN